MSLNVAELLVATLVAEGVKRIYGITGDSLNGIASALRSTPEITWIPVRHEETAAFAAGAEAHVTGRLTVCAGSCGPGNLHLINGLYDCHRSRLPVLAIAAQVPTRELGSAYFQETHPEHLFAECSHFCELVSDVAQMPRLLEIAIRTALAKRGVAVLVLPGDVALREAAESSPRSRLAYAPPELKPAPEDLARLAEALNGAEKVTILGGAGCEGAHAELVETAARLQAPIVHALRGKEFIEYENPYDVGMTGLLGFASGYHAMMDCDLLLMLGTDFPYPQFFPKHATIVQIDSRGEQLGRRTRLDHGFVGDIRTTLRALLPALTVRPAGAHLEKSLAHYRETRADLDKLAEERAGETPLHPQHVTRVPDQLAAEDAIFTCDVGTPTIWAARYLRMNGRRRLVGSFTHGSMAGALPQAIGAQLAFPERQVITLSGDGGVAMLMGDLLTLIQLRLPVKLVVFRNDALSFVELEMKAEGLVQFATDLKNPEFAKVAEAIGLMGLKAETLAQLEPMLRQALAHDGPALVEAVVHRQELSMPPTITPHQVLGFGLYTMRAVLSGHGGEIVDLAKTNLLR